VHGHQGHPARCRGLVRVRVRRLAERGSVHANDDRRRRIGVRVVLADDDQRRFRGRTQAGGDRAQQEPGHAPEPAIADHDQLGPLGLGGEHGDREPDDELLLHLDPLGRACNEGDRVGEVC
jgi:hypothetical protein